MIHLTSISLKPGARRESAFPFNLPLVKHFQTLEIEAPVTFFVGENGSGKSTLLEAIAAATGSVSVGGEDLDRDRSLDHARRLGRQLKLTWRQKTRRGFFLRAEDFFNFARRLQSMQAELAKMADDF